MRFWFVLCTIFDYEQQVQFKRGHNKPESHKFKPGHDFSQSSCFLMLLDNFFVSFFNLPRQLLFLALCFFIFQLFLFISRPSTLYFFTSLFQCSRQTNTNKVFGLTNTRLFIYLTTKLACVKQQNSILMALSNALRITLISLMQRLRDKAEKTALNKALTIE